MSTFQTNTLFSTITIAILWLIFCIKILSIDIYVWVLWAITSLCIWLRIWRNQKRMWFVGWVFSILTALSFLFSVIPVYDYKASLQWLYAWEIPTIICNQSNKGTISIDSLTISMSDICKRNWFPLLTEQTIDIQTTQPLLINLAMGDSILLDPEYKWTLKRNIVDWMPQFTLSPLPEKQTTQNLNQTSIQQSFLKKKQDYLHKNFPRKREYAPTITKIAIRKMRLLSLIDRSYDDKVRSLQFYMKEIN
jgi:hypothetical protein